MLLGERWEYSSLVHCYCQQPPGRYIAGDEVWLDADTMRELSMEEKFKRLEPYQKIGGET